MISDIQEVPSPSPAVRPSDRLSLAIGRVCQADVWLEYSLVSLYRSLAGPGLGSAVPPVTFATLLSSGRTMLRLADLPEPWAATARDALSAAEHAHSVRNIRARHLVERSSGPGPAPLSAIDPWQKLAVAANRAPQNRRHRTRSRGNASCVRQDPSPHDSVAAAPAVARRNRPRRAKSGWTCHRPGQVRTRRRWQHSATQVGEPTAASRGVESSLATTAIAAATHVGGSSTFAFWPVGYSGQIW